MRGGVAGAPCLAAGCGMASAAVAEIVRRFMAAAVTGIGAFVLASWLVDGPRLGQSIGVADVPPMTPAGAMAFVLAGIAIGCAGREAGRLARGVRTLCAAGVAVLGVLLLGESVLGWPLGFLRTHAIAPAATADAAPNAAVGFVLFAAATFALDRITTSGRVPGHVLLAGVAAVSAPVVVGYAYRVDGLFAMPGHVAMAPHAGLTLLLAAVGLLAARPDRGFLVTAAGDGPGALVIRRLYAPLVPFTMVLGWLCLRGQQRGLYEPPTGTALFALLMVTVFGTLIWRTAAALDRADEERTSALQTLRITETSEALAWDIGRAAQAASEAKSAFLANMSHELRTPMTAILGYLELLAHEPFAEEHGRHVETVRRNAEHLLAIINDILDLAKVESGKLALERRPCDPVAVVQDVLALMNVRARVKGLTLELRTAGPVPAQVTTDPVRLRQILTNLVGNAVKFTEQGRVEVEIAISQHDASGAPRLGFAVRDTGVGIAESEISRLFRPFMQGGAGVRHGGTGLGLVLSRRLAEALGGTLTVRSRPGEGSEFTLVIPAGPLEEHAREPLAGYPAPAAAPTGLPTLRGRVLLAEDSLDNQRLLALHLQRAGGDVTVANDGATALELVTRAERAGTPFDLVFLDLDMPVLDGRQAARAMRRAGVTARIVALTAHAMADARTACLEAGCDDFLPKPVDRATLLAVAHRHLEQRAAAAA